MDATAVRKLVKSVLGNSDDDVVSVLQRGIRKGYDQKRYFEKLSDCLDDASATKIIDKVFLELNPSSDKHKKRRKFVENPDEDDVAKKKPKLSSDDNHHRSSSPGRASPRHDAKPAPKHRSHRSSRSRSPESDANKEEPKGIQDAPTKPISQTAINKLIQDAKRELEEKKKKMNLSGIGSIKPGEASQYMQDALEKQKKLDALKASVSSKLASSTLSGIIDLKKLSSVGKTGSSTMSPAPTGSSKPAAISTPPPPLPATPSSSAAISLTSRIPTLKANQRVASEKGASQSLLDSTKKPQRSVIEEPEGEAAKNYDFRLTTKGPNRKRRMLNFREKGEFEKMANKMRAKAKLELLQQSISSASKKTGISSAAKLALIVPKGGVEDEPIPDVEWWDHIILGENSYNCDPSALDYTPITSLIEHPIQLAPPGYQPERELVGLRTHLTKKERKKLRRQNRKEMQREINEKVRLGLEPAPEPKVKISNLMRVLGSEAIQDPTKMEAHVREQMAKRQKKHEEANEARKLTAGERKEKKKRKIIEDVSQGVLVAVYRITDLSNPAKKYKVETNAKQQYMTGTVVLHKDCNVVVVEGGPRQQKFYKNVILNRLKWQDDQVFNHTKGEEEPNACVLVWEGVVKERNFGEIKFKTCPLEKAAREHFQIHHVEHYWDLAFSGTVLQQSEDFVAY